MTPQCPISYVQQRFAVEKYQVKNQFDNQIEFGVTKFCENCRKCTDACPPKAIPDGEPSPVKLNLSSISGVKKWSVDGEKCFSYWGKIVSDCMICMRVCPYNKDFTKFRHKIGLRLASTKLRNIMLMLNDFFDYGERLKPKAWWNGESRRRI